MYKGKSTKITADFSMETLKARRVWNEVFQALNENYSGLGYSSQKNYHSKLIKQQKSSTINEIKTIYDHQATTTENSTRNSAHRR
jgi:hypothetical protein